MSEWIEVTNEEEKKEKAKFWEPETVGNFIQGIYLDIFNYKILGEIFVDECWEFILENRKSAAEVFVYTHKVYDEEEWNNVLKRIFNAKDEEGNKLFWRKEESMLIPIKMTQTARPNKKTPEYEEYIEPWIREMMENAFNNWNRYEKNHLH